MRARHLARWPSLLWALALLITPVAAHAASGLPATITVTPESAGPGSQVQVAGLDFPAGQTIQLQLTTTAGVVHVGTATTRDGGYFRQTVTLPADLAPGYWEVRASAPDGSVAVLIMEAGEAAPAVVGSEAVREVDGVAPGGPSGADMVVMLVIAVLLASVGGAVAYAWYMVHRDVRQPGMGAGDDPIWNSAPGDDPMWNNPPRDDPMWNSAPATVPPPPRSAEPAS